MHILPCYTKCLVTKGHKHYSLIPPFSPCNRNPDVTPPDVTYHEIVFTGKHLPDKTRLQGIQLQITASEISQPLNMHKMDT